MHVATEILDVVDDDDRVLFRAPKDQVYREYRIHRSVMFFIFDAEGNVFVNQRSDSKELYPSYWSIALGGHVRSGETYDAAVRRELLEETGLATPPEFIRTFKKRTADSRENVNVYAVVADREPNLDPRELQEGYWVSIADIGRYLNRYDFLPETDDLMRILVEYTARKDR